MARAASEIYQENLDIVSRALMACDWPTMLERIGMPNMIRTDDAEKLIDTPNMLILTVQDYRAFLLGIGTTDYIRLCLGAAFDPDTDRGVIRGSHRTYMLGSGGYLMEPFLSHMTLELQNGIWRSVLIESHVVNHHCTVLSPRLFRDPQQTDERHDADRG